MTPPPGPGLSFNAVTTKSLAASIKTIVSTTTLPDQEIICWLSDYLISFFSAVVIVAVISWLLPILGLLIKFNSKGPVFFRQKRIGRHGNPFICLKLRTMIVNMEADETPAQENDYRITKLGSFLRQTHLDELPQFFNVLTGEMSIVGPRPHMTADCIRFSFIVPSYAFRHSVKPGITGWAQAKGYHGLTTDYESVVNRYHWDAQYVRKAGLWLDIKIVALTAAKSIRQFLQ